MSLSPGMKLGPYEILAPLGAGGMGEVYTARDTRLGRDVAIKVLPADVAADPERLMRFEREAKAVSALNHPHIVTLYEVGTSDAGPYLVLEKIQGRSLREVLDAGPMPIRRILVLASQIAEGIAKAHSAGIVHRDLKPGNVMVTDDGHAKVLDFGLAKLVWPELGAGSIEEATTLAKDTASGVVLGTLGYLSPEQASGKPADYRADQFALGALMYELATGERPFKRATLLESLTATIREEPEPARSKRPDLPAPFEWLIERCLAKDPNDRYSSTSDLARELASLRDHLSDLTRMPAGDAAPIRARVLPRGWLGWTLATAAVAAIAVFSFILARQTVDAPPPPSYRPLTFERGLITGARFGRDGKTVYYSAVYGAEPSRIFVTHLERIESKRVDVPAGFLLAVSSKDELAVLLTNQRATYSVPGVLARVPAVGGTPRPVAEDVIYADWGPDGEQLAISRSSGQREFPVGSVVARCGTVRVSPGATHLAMMIGGRLEIRDTKGRQLAVAGVPFVFGSAWSPDGREVWFTGSETGSPHDRALYALSVTGARRLIARMAGAMTIHDVAPDGKSALISTGAGWFGVNAATVDGNRERSLDVAGRSEIVGLSRDGKSLLINESREVGTGTHLRSTDGVSSVRLTGHKARGLTPDGAWALVQPQGDVKRLLLVPTGAGAEREVPLNPELEASVLEFAQWSRDGQRLFMWLREVGGDVRAVKLYVRDGDRPWQAVTGVLPPRPFAVSPDGQEVAVRDETGVVALFPIDGKAPRRLDGERGRPIHWSADGRRLFLLGQELFPARVYRRDLASGRVEPWRTIAPADPTGVLLIGGVLIADDERSFVYQYSRGLNDLYLARGLK